MNMREAVESFLTSLSQNEASANTTRSYRADLIGLSDFLGNPMAIRENVEPMAKTWMSLNRELWAPTTSKRKLSSLKSWGDFMGWPGFMAGYKTPKPADPIPHPIPEGPPGVMRMLNVSVDRPEKCALVALTGLLGMRVSSAIRVKAEHFNTHEMTVKVWLKGNRNATLPVTDTAWLYITPAYIQALTRDKEALKFDTRLVRASDRTARRWITNIGEEAELSRRVASHDMRATAGTAAYKKTKDLRATQQFLCHTSSRTTEVYTQVLMDDMRKAADFI